MNEPTIHVVPHMHYDAVWILNRQDYYFVNIEVILKQAIDLIKKADYKFMIEQTYLLEKIEKDYPHLFAEISDLIKENKIEIAGGQYLLADTMIPNGEVLIREIIEGKKFVKQKFGHDIFVAYGADEFGFNAQWPQILKNAGYKYCIFRRGIDNAVPSEFYWEGIDGSRILTHWMPLGYRAGLFLDELDKAYRKLKTHSSTNQILMLSGSGSTPPQPELIKVIKEWNEKSIDKNGNFTKNYKMSISTPVSFFKALEKQNIKFKIRKGEMYSGKFSAVYPNSTSSRMWIKQGAKEFENSLLLLERLDTIAGLINIHDENISDLLSKYWKEMLFIAMHDVLPGTGVDEVYKEIKEIFDNAKKSIGSCIQEYLKKLSQKTGNNSDIFIFNPLSWEVTNWTELSLEFNEKEIMGISELIDNDQKIDIEILDYSLYPDNSIKRINIGFIITVPSLGYKTLKIVKSDNMDSETIITHDTTFNNKEYEIEVNRENAIITITKTDKNKNKITYLKGNEICLEEEIGDLYYHRANLDLVKSESGEGIKYGIFNPEKYDVVKGKLRTHIKFKSKYYALRWPYRFTEKLKPVLFRHDFIDIEKEIIIFKNLNRIDFKTHIHHKHPNSRLRVKFDTSIKSTNYWCGTQFGAVKRSTNLYYKRNESGWFEKPSGVFPSFEWIDYVSEKDRKNKRIGVSLLHHGIPSHEVRDNMMYLTLLRSIVLLSADGLMGPCIPTPDASEMRPYTFRYSILPHENDWRKDNIYKYGMEINMPLISFQVKQNGKNTNKNLRSDDTILQDLPNSKSFLKIDKKNVILSTMKLDDNKRSIVLRVYETEGTKTNARIQLPLNIKYAEIIDFNGNKLQTLEKIENNALQVEMHPYKILTIRILFFS